MIKWGIIGCGRIAHRFMQGFAAVEEVELVASYSRRAETVDAFVAQYGGIACRSIDELLASDICLLYTSPSPRDS